MPQMHRTVASWIQGDFIIVQISLFCLSFILSYVLLRNKFGQGLNKVPGPWIAGFTNLYRLQRVLTGKAHLYDIRLHRKYGSVVRLGPNFVSIGDPQAISTIYGITASLPKVSPQKVYTKINVNTTNKPCSLASTP